MRIAIAGLGWAARSFHLPALEKLPDATLVAAADPAPGARRWWEQRTGSPAFDDLGTLLAAVPVELVIVATPPASHAELCLAALQAGAHVVCEKPFASTVEEADVVLAAAEVVGRHVVVNHEFREMPIFKALIERIGTPAVGRLVFCQVWQLMDLAPWDEPVPWRAAMPRRTLFEGGTHLVDLLLAMYGEAPSGVYARHSAGLDPARTGDAIHLVTLDFPDGRLAQITIDRLCRAGTRYVEVRADCESASLRASSGGRAVLQVGKKRAERAGARLDLGGGGLAWEERGLRRRTLARNPRQAGAHATGAVLARTLAALASGVTPPSSGTDGRHALAVIAAAYRSAASGERVELADPGGR